MKTITSENVETISALDIEKTYRGKTGCACGCGGDYIYFGDTDSVTKILKHYNYIVRGIKQGKALFFGNGVEVENPSGTSVTRIYFSKGISYEQYASGRIERTETKEAN